jgi:hypothetical protein
MKHVNKAAKGDVNANPVIAIPAALDANPLNVATGTGGTAATVTKAAMAGHKHVIYGFDFSYDIDPAAAALLTITDAGDVVYKTYVTAKGAGPIAFPVGIRSRKPNTAMVASLAGGGGAAVATLTIFHEAVPG